MTDATSYHRKFGRAVGDCWCGHDKRHHDDLGFCGENGCACVQFKRL